MKKIQLITPLVRALVCMACVFWVGQASAANCTVSAKITNGKNGAPATGIAVTASTGRLTNYYLELNIDSYTGARNTSGNGLTGDFCSITYGKANEITVDTVLANSPWSITYGTSETSQAANCSSSNYDWTQPVNGSLSPFVNGFSTYDGSLIYFSRTKASIFWSTDTSGKTDACRNSKVFIPLTIDYTMGSNSTFTIDPLHLFKNNAFCCNNSWALGNTQSSSGSVTKFIKVAGSCTVSAPSLSLGTFTINDPKTLGILGGKLKSTTVTLNCNNVYAGQTIKPTITITDAAAPDSIECDPTNTATNPAANSRIALFTSSTIAMDAASRYCVSTVGGTFNNIMVYPDITSSVYLQSKPIYAGILNTGTVTAGQLVSTLRLTVNYQ
jgi:hypothetical protein